MQYYYPYQPTQPAAGPAEGWAKVKKGLSRARFW